MAVKTLRKTRKRDKIYFLFEGKIYEETLNDRYYLYNYLYIETDRFKTKVPGNLLNQTKVELENIIIATNRKELEGVKA